MGGGLPLSAIERPLGAHTIVVPIANHDDRQHSFDENRACRTCGTASS
jgi:hypothetical protein